MSQLYIKKWHVFVSWEFALAVGILVAKHCPPILVRYTVEERAPSADIRLAFCCALSIKCSLANIALLRCPEHAAVDFQLARVSTHKPRRREHIGHVTTPPSASQEPQS